MCSYSDPVDLCAGCGEPLTDSVDPWVCVDGEEWHLVCAEGYGAYQRQREKEEAEEELAFERGERRWGASEIVVSLCGFVAGMIATFLLCE